MYSHTQTQHKIKKSQQEINGEIRVGNINEPLEQEIDRQSESDSNSYQPADNISDGKEEQGDIHSTPLAQRKSAHERKLPKKYNGFILGLIKQLNAIWKIIYLEESLLPTKILKFVFNDGPVFILKHHGRCFFSKEGSM